MNPNDDLMYYHILDDLSVALVITFVDADGNPICGSVAFSNGDRYVWMLVDGVYYVLVDGEWVPIDEDEEWEPGEPLPCGVG